MPAPVPPADGAGSAELRPGRWHVVVAGTGLVRPAENGPADGGPAAALAVLHAGDVLVAATGHRLQVASADGLLMEEFAAHDLPDTLAGDRPLDRWFTELRRNAGLPAPPPSTGSDAPSGRPDPERLLAQAEDDSGSLVSHIQHTRAAAFSARAERLRAAVADTHDLDHSSIALIADGIPQLRVPGGLPAADPAGEVMRVIGFPVPARGTDTPSADPGPDAELAPLQDLAVRARAAGHVLRTVDLRGDVRHDLDQPVVAVLRGGPVALLPTLRGVVLVDPTTGGRRRLRAEDRAQLGETALAGIRELPAVANARHLGRLALQGRRGDLALLIAFMVGVGLTSLLLPLAGGAIFGSIVPDDQYGRLVALVVALLCVIAATAGLDIATGRLAARLRTRVDAVTGDALWSRLLRLPAGFFGRFGTGELLGRASAVDTLRSLVGESLLGGLTAAVTAVVSLALVFTQGSAAGLLTTGVLLAQIAVFTVILRLRRPLLSRQVREGTAAQNLTLQTMRGIGRIRAFTAEERVMTQLSGRFLDTSRTGYLDARLTGVQSAVFAGWPTLGTLAITAGVVLADSGTLGVAGYVTLTTALGQVLAGTSALIATADQLVAVRPQLELLAPLLEATPEGGNAQGAQVSLGGAVEVSHLTFRYRPDGPAILTDVSLAARPGEFVAVVGPSGSGKSTLLRLLLGFEHPETGTVSYDGHDLSKLDLRHVRRQIGTVLQSAQLLPGSLADNIRGSRPLTREQVWQAAEWASVAADIEAMPMQMQTVVVEGASTISGGQRQRVVIARAVAGDPRILLLDEATSALDNVTQAQVAQSLAGMQRTRVVIAHRLSTIVDADRILVMDAGRIVQSGTYEELVACPGLFLDLAQRQMADPL